MPLYLLNQEIVFPPPSHARADGLLAIGGDLSPERLLNAYSNGIFPWYSEGEPICWYCTRPRAVIFPPNLHVPKSMRPLLNRAPWEITVDSDFQSVIRNCGTISRPGQLGTWIHPDIIEAFCRLHELGHAHSIEVRENGKLIAGFYGIGMGSIFFGESMFTLVPNASKYGFIRFVQVAAKLGFTLIDCQQHTSHMARFGAEEIRLNKFLNLLQEGIANPILSGEWRHKFEFSKANP